MVQLRTTEKSLRTIINDFIYITDAIWVIAEKNVVPVFFKSIAFLFFNYRQKCCYYKQL